MPRPGRNQPCPCGSGRKVKRCCGQRRGPSEEQLARALVAHHGREAARELVDASDAELQDLWQDLLDLPERDLSLLVTVPQLISPDLQRLREAVADDDPDRGWDALTAVANQIDTPIQRAELARALLDLRDARRIDRRQAAVALLDLDSRSTRFIGASLLQTVAISVGASRTPGGLLVAA